MLRLQPDDTEDLVIASALAAAIEYGIGKTNNRWPADATDLCPRRRMRRALLTRPVSIGAEIHLTARLRGATRAPFGWAVSIPRLNGCTPLLARWYSDELATCR